MNKVSEHSDNKRKKIGGVFTTGVVAVVVLVGVLSVGYMLYATVSDRDLSPEEMILTAYSNLVNAGSFAFTINGSVEDSDQGVDVEYEIEGLVDIQDQLRNSSVQISPRVSGTLEGGGMMPVNTIDIAGQIRVIDNMVYFQIEKMPAILSLFLPLRVDEWMFVELEESLGDEEEVNQAFLREEILRLLQEQPPYSITELPQGVIDGEEVYVYSVQIKQDELGEFYERVLSVMNESGIDIPAEVESQVVEEVSQWDDESMDIDFIVMIGKDDRNFHSMNISVEVFEDGEEGSVSQMEVVFSGIGEDVEIEVPEGARSIEELFQTATESVEEIDINRE